MHSTPGSKPPSDPPPGFGRLDKGAGALHIGSNPDAPAVLPVATPDDEDAAGRLDGPFGRDDGAGGRLAPPVLLLAATVLPKGPDRAGLADVRPGSVVGRGDGARPSWPAIAAAVMLAVLLHAGLLIGLETLRLPPPAEGGSEIPVEIVVQPRMVPGTPVVEPAAQQAVGPAEDLHRTAEVPAAAESPQPVAAPAIPPLPDASAPAPAAPALPTMTAAQPPPEAAAPLTASPPEPAPPAAEPAPTPAAVQPATVQPVEPPSVGPPAAEPPAALLAPSPEAPAVVSEPPSVAQVTAAPSPLEAAPRPADPPTIIESPPVAGPVVPSLPKTSPPDVTSAPAPPAEPVPPAAAPAAPRKPIVPSAPPETPDEPAPPSAAELSAARAREAAVAAARQRAAELRAEARVAAEAKAAQARRAALAEAKAAAARAAHDAQRRATLTAAPLADPGDDGPSADAAGYGREVVGRIMATKRYPEAARERGAQGTAIVSFSIGASGEASGIALARSSGDSALDAEAVATVRRASPFSPPPRGAARRFSAPLAFRVR